MSSYRNTLSSSIIKLPLTEQQEKPFSFRLYVTGQTPRSTQAIATVKTVLEQHLVGRYQLQVIDISHQPMLAEDDEIIAVPTLIKISPLPFRRLVGDITDEAKIIAELDLDRGY